MPGSHTRNIIIGNNVMTCTIVPDWLGKNKLSLAVDYFSVDGINRFYFSRNILSPRDFLMRGRHGHFSDERSIPRYIW